jgi:very-short-patch-repair endonuclease
VLPPWQLVDRVRVPSAAETVLSCARDLTLLDVVLIGDAALHCGDVTREQLIAVSRLRRRGSPLLRRAIPLMDARAESIFEGLLRVLHVVSGIKVEPQAILRDATGGFVARADLLLVGTRTLHEADGSHHRLAHQHAMDLSRERRLVRAGFVRRGYAPNDVLTRSAAIIRDAELTLDLEHDPDRLQPWYELLRESLFSSAGQRRLMLRLGLVTENADERLE